MKQLFQSARFKLTAWYLFIIMVISILFSLFIYSGINGEFKRLERLQEEIEQQEQMGMPYSRIFRGSPRMRINLDAIAEARRNLISNLALVNGGIFLFSALAGYFLAGKTLEPIQEMVDEQDRFITDASHELRTPIAAMRAEIEVGLLNKKLNLREAKELIKSNLEEVINLQTLSDNLLALSHSERQSNLSAFKTISIKEIIDNAVKKVRPMAKKKNIEIKNNVTEQKIYGNKQQLEEVFIIILDNAIKYSEEKGIVMLSSRIHGNDLTLAVMDTGVGIDKEDLPYIFDRFYRSESSRSKADVNGYGLGLSIAQKIVNLHGGKITAKSEVNRGTTFMVILPLS
jgi:signal transduction histidine kinase